MFGTPQPHAWISVFQRIHARPLTPSLSSSDGERVPFRAGEGKSVALPRFHGLGCVMLRRSQHPSRTARLVRPTDP